jgi:hypothetical protein
MNRLRHALLAFCILLGVPGGASAQDNRDKPVDLKPLVPPVFPLPPNSQLNPGSVGGTQTPYTTAPLQNSGTPTTQSAPGLRLTIPSRQDRN